VPEDRELRGVDAPLDRRARALALGVRERERLRDDLLRHEEAAHPGRDARVVRDDDVRAGQEHRDGRGHARTRVVDVDGIVRAPDPT